jgi:hypothetical protein
VPQVTGMKPRIRIECPDGMALSTRIFVDDIDISDQVQAVTWTLDVKDKYAYAVANIRVVLPTANLTTPDAAFEEILEESTTDASSS